LPDPAPATEVLVLLSGGIDSAACVDFFIKLGRRPCGLFVDYGQEPASEEHSAAVRVAKHYGIALHKTTWRGISKKLPGLIQGRNFFLLAAAVLERPSEVSVIAAGIHAGTAYADCSQAFVEASMAAIRAAGEESVSISTPFLSWSKADIYEYCRQQNVPVPITHSCEQANGPCDVCLSCQDRRMWHASA
jgi:7-cyano-7-deazaguanine synthase